MIIIVLVAIATFIMVVSAEWLATRLSIDPSGIVLFVMLLFVILRIDYQLYITKKD